MELTQHISNGIAIALNVQFLAIVLNILFHLLLNVDELFLKNVFAVGPVGIPA